MDSVWLLDAARSQLEKLSSSPCLGWLLGWRSNLRIEVLNVCTFLSKSGSILRTTAALYSLQDEISELQDALPPGLEVLGCLAVYDKQIPMSILTLVKSLHKLSSRANGLVSKSGPSLSGIWLMDEFNLYIDGKGCDFNNMSKQESQFCSNHLHLRWNLNTNVPLFVGMDGQRSDLIHTITGDCDDQDLMFQIEDEGTKQKEFVPAKGQRSLMNIFPKSEYSVFDCSVLVSSKTQSLKAPSLRIKKITRGLQVEAKNLAIHLEIHCFVPISTPASDLFKKYLKPTLAHHLSRFQPDSQQFCTLGVELDGYVFPIMAHYQFLPDATNDEATQQQFRQKLHKRFLQKENRPIFKASCSLTSTIATDRLMNIHQHLPNKEFGPGMVALVQGTYEYCHYGQDKIEDSGWGCAYRSLQTVFSWFVHQNYTTMEIPSHTKIQEVLVELGDKEPSFYGSKDWIGSIEVGTVLNELLDVEYQIVSKPCHQEVSSIARELVHHFRSEGTPVSIGGGVLAYTLLGIYFDDQTGEVEMLILDPHYKGKDEVNPILKGGWIKWRTPNEKAAAGGPLFVNNTHYNFMCPKRPSIV